MLTRIINAHPNIIQTYETSVFLLLSDIIKKTSIGVKAGFFYGKEYPELLSASFKKYAKKIIVHYYEKIAKEQSREKVLYWGDKHPHHSAMMDFIVELFPNAKFIYIIRDPRDTTCSICKMNSIEFREGLEIWNNISEKYEKYIVNLSDEHLFSVRYEDILSVGYTEKTNEILKWLGLSMDPAIDTYITKNQYTDFHTKSLRKHDFKQRSLERWRRELTQEQNALAIQTTRDFLEKYGYNTNFTV